MTEPTDAELEALAVEHEAFGFGRADKQGLSTHGFDPDGLQKFARAVLAKWGQPQAVREPVATPCPTCGAPCSTETHMRGGDWGWGTTDAERTTYRYTAPPPQAVREPQKGKVSVALSSVYLMLPATTAQVAERHGVSKAHARRLVRELVQLGYAYCNGQEAQAKGRAVPVYHRSEKAPT